MARTVRTLSERDAARRARRGTAWSVLLLALLPLLLATPAWRAAAPAATWGDAVPSAMHAVRTWLTGPPVVGLQVGHLRAAAHPEELAALRTSTGGHAAGIDEVTINAAVAEALARRLRDVGVRVEILDATLPPGYRADVLLALHADAHDDPRRRGYKSAHFRPARNPREPPLQAAIDAAYLAASGLPADDANVSGAMNRYYAFHHRRYRHAAHPATAALIVEMGYLTHPDDRAWLTTPQRPAAALADGVLAYLQAQGRWRPPPGTDLASLPEGGSGASPAAPEGRREP